MAGPERSLIDMSGRLRCSAAGWHMQPDRDTASKASEIYLLDDVARIDTAIHTGSSPTRRL